MHTESLYRPLLALSFITFVHCQGDTPPKYTPDSDDKTAPTDSESPWETDSFFPNDSDSTMNIDTESDTAVHIDTGLATDTDLDTGSATDVDLDTALDTDEVTSRPWWDCAFKKRRSIGISGVSQIDPEHALSLIFDHRTLVSSNLSHPDGRDVRIVHWNGTSYQELPRVVDPLSSWNLENTKIWFSFRESAFSTTGEEFIDLYYGNGQPGYPPDKEDDVFHFADFFERDNSSNLGNQWIEYTAPNTNIEIKDHAMSFAETGNAINRPGADHALAPLSSRFSLRFGFDWSFSVQETNYRLHIQLGDLAAMEQTPLQTEGWFSRASVGPHLLWASASQGMANEQGFGYEAGGVVSEVAAISGEANIQVDVDMATKTYSLAIDNGAPTVNIPFSQAIGTIDAIRFFTWELKTEKIATSLFNYVIINKTSQTLPTVNVLTNSPEADYGDWCPGN